MVLGENWSSASIVIVILFNIITKPQLVVIRSRGSLWCFKIPGGKNLL